MGEISVKTGNNARNGGKNSLNRLIRCVCGKKIGPDPRNFNQRVSLGRNDLLIRTFPRLSVAIQGNCYDNAPMESFWGTLKNESLSHYRFNNRDEAISVIREYIEIFYNRQRRHSRLGNISPAAFREKYHQMAA
ncbi:transposase [Escherichia coli]|nr:hypothetical protein [Escherichia coli]MSH00947.1 transposase [Escherichia coli]MSH39105.1 transposase [Escherichia coli]MSI42528.1 transposase [Escherichia coli]